MSAAYHSETIKGKLFQVVYTYKDILAVSMSSTTCKDCGDNILIKLEAKTLHAWLGERIKESEETK